MKKVLNYFNQKKKMKDFLVSYFISQLIALTIKYIFKSDNFYKIKLFHFKMKKYFKINNKVKVGSFR